MVRYLINSTINIILPDNFLDQVVANKLCPGIESTYPSNHPAVATPNTINPKPTVKLLTLASGKEKRNIKAVLVRIQNNIPVLFPFFKIIWLNNIV